MSEQRPNEPKLLHGRGVGNTTNQMRAAPKGAVFVWVNGHLDYPKRLAKGLDREDLKIVSPDWVIDKRWMGLELSGLVVDHAVRFSEGLMYALEGARTRVR